MYVWVLGLVKLRVQFHHSKFICTLPRNLQLVFFIVHNKMHASVKEGKLFELV